MYAYIPNVEIGKGVYILWGSYHAIHKNRKLCNDKYGSKCCSSFYIARRYFPFYGVNFGASIIANKYAYIGISAIMT